MTSRAGTRRRARYIAAHLIETSIDAGMELAERTGNGTMAEAGQLEIALRDIANMIRRPLPLGYDPDVLATGSARRTGESR